MSMTLRASIAAATFAAMACTPAAYAKTPAKPATAPDITVDIDVGEPLMIAGKDQTAYVKITLGGFALPQSQRAPINLALVLDRSSSMSGDKFEKAKEAALLVVDRLQPNDVISVISYDSTVEVLVPAIKAEERDFIRQRIQALTPRGSTALFAGVSYGIEEVAKFLDPKRVNRIILLSDGQANIGPSSPNELARLGQVAGKQGISISTIGLGVGYNEDLMTQLAMASDGNHAYARTAEDLVAIFQHELGDIMSVVAQDVEVEIIFEDGVIPVRSLYREATINGNKVRLSLNQLYAKQEKFALLEVKVPAGKADTTRRVASVDVRYANMVTHKKVKRRDALQIGFTSSAAKARAQQNADVMVAAVEAIATDRNRQALALRDQGKIKEAEAALKGNAAYLAKENQKLKSKRLEKYAKDNEKDADNLAPAQWNETRKSMREGQHSNSTQRSW
ncbi:MAG TPA: VWA domain-containing protein [Kofleriaceae bacterium]|nr:VWA domain-containing protein [Kofleriaceae bacterium]